MYLSSVAPPMKNMMPVSSYKNYVFAFIPLSQSSGDLYLFIYSKGNLNHNILEFNISTKKYKPVNAIERADKNYFVVLKPKRNTIADAALEKI